MIKLYGMKSPYVQRVKAALEFKKLPYEHVSVNLRNKSDTFNQLSPIGKVPVLEDSDGTVVWDSSNIATYLDLMYPDTYQMLSFDPKKRAQIGNIVAMANNILDVAAPIFQEAIGIATVSKQDKEMACIDLKYRLQRAHGLLRNKRFFVDDRFTFADASMLSALSVLEKLSIELGDFSEWYQKKIADTDIALMFLEPGETAKNSI